MKRGARGFTELAAVVPGEVIATVEDVMASNVLHGVDANGVLNLWRTRGVMHLAELDLFDQRPGAPAGS